MNLSTEQANDSSSPKTMSSLGLMVVSVVFVATAIATGGLVLWKNDLKKQMDSAELAYQEKYTQLLEEDRNKDVVDFQSRIDMADNMINEKNIALDNMQFVEKNIVPGAYLTSYMNSKKDGLLSLKGVADSHDTIARQILSFKTSDLFSSVDVTDIKVSDKGEIIFSMELKTN